MNKILWLSLVSVVLSCSTPRVHRGPAATPSFFTNEIRSVNEFGSLAVTGDGIVRGGQAVKFLIDWRKPEPQIYFLNANFSVHGKIPEYVKYHYTFAQRAVGYKQNLNAFNQTAYFEPNFAKRQFTAGTLQFYDLKSDSGVERILGIQFYPQDSIHEEGMLKAALTVQAKIASMGLPLAVISYGSQQTFANVKRILLDHSIQALTVETILGSITYVPMNTGEAWGYLNVYPEHQDQLTPFDIPVFKDLPLELSVVAGVITVALQDPGSHINLKSKERGTPNMIVRNEKQIEVFKDYQRRGVPVHLTVGASEFTIEPTTEQIVQQKFASHQAKNWQKVPSPIDSPIQTFEQMCPSSPSLCLAASRKFGGKAAKLGFINHRRVAGVGSPIQKQLGYRLSSYGFGVPLTFYKTFVDANPALKMKLDSYIRLEMSAQPVTPSDRERLTAEIRQMFYQAKVPANILKEIRLQLLALKKQVESENAGVELKKVKMRSSANVEDLAGFNGAGLHDSFGAKLKGKDDPNEVCAVESSSDDDADEVETKSEMNPPTLNCSIKGVYASLWNKRAVEERNFRKLDHTSALMALAIVPSYNYLAKLSDPHAPANGMEETSNSVIVTRVLNTSGVYGYTLSTQVAPNLVTNPAPGSQAEVAIATFLTATEPVQLTYTQMARPSRQDVVRDQPILERANVQKVIRVAQAIETAYCQANKNYYSGDCQDVIGDPTKPRALDMEYKYLGTGQNLRILVKQMREYGGN